VSVFRKPLEIRGYFFGCEDLFHLISAWLLAERVFANKVD